MPHSSISTAFVLALLLCTTCVTAAPAIIVDTQDASLSVVEQNTTLLKLEQIAIGRFGASENKQLGDGTTPIGRYQVGWFKPHSKFNHFIGFNYPSAADAERGLKQGIIDQPTYQRIITAHRDKKVPPQDTPLGGFLGIHGLGEADPNVHRRYNWTRGCIATTNEQLKQLLPWLTKGMWVELR